MVKGETGGTPPTGVIGDTVTEPPLKFRDFPGWRTRYVVSIVLAVVGAAGLYYGLILLSDPRFSALAPVGKRDPVAVVAIMVGFVSITTIMVLNVSLRREYADYLRQKLMGDANQAVDEITGPADLMGLMRANRKQMEAYDALARSHASSTHIATLWAAAFGLLAVGAGLFVAITADAAAAKYAAAIVAAVGTGTSGYIAATFIRVSDGAREQARYYFQQPLIQSYLLSAERLLDKLTDQGDRADQTKKIIGAAIAQTTDISKLVTSEPTNGGQTQTPSAGPRRKWPRSK